jgi:hypothetical protein
VILVCGGLADIVTELVCSRLEAMQRPYRLLDLGRFPEGVEVEWTWSGRDVSGFIRTGDWALDLASITGVFVRYLGMDGHAPFTNLPAGHENAALGEGQSGLVALLEAMTCPVANKASVSMSNCSKPYQALLVRESGLLTPPTLITNDPDAALEFFEECGRRVIFKSLSGVRSTVREFDDRDRDRLPLLQHGPAQFQRFLPGDNIRVHHRREAIGRESDPAPWITVMRATKARTRISRRPSSSCRHRRLRRSELAHGMLLAGIDLKETPDGEHYCFEVNRLPVCLLQQHTGQPISAVLWRHSTSRFLRGRRR